jgi:Bacterial Ig-like domain
MYQRLLMVILVFILLFVSISVASAAGNNNSTKIIVKNSDLLNHNSSLNIIKPYKLSSNPLNNSLNVPINKPIKIVYSEPVKFSNKWIELKNGEGQLTSVKKTIMGRTLALTPTKLLRGGYNLHCFSAH